MNARQKSILARLGSGFSFTAPELASGIGAPVASVRRAVGSLRAQGYDITSSSAGYTLHDAFDTTIEDTDGEDVLADDDIYDDGGW